MSLVIRLYRIESPNDFKVEIKPSYTPYPLDSGYIYINEYSGGTTQIEINGYTDHNVSRPFDFGRQYWVKTTDLVTNRYIIESIVLNEQIAYEECPCYPPLILTLECYNDELQCDLELSAIYISQ